MDQDRDDDPLLRDLAAFAREEEAREEALLDGRWEDLARGELSPEELARLTARTAEAEGAEEARRRQDAFRPLGGAFQARIAARVLKELGTGRPPRPILGRLGWRGLAAAAALVGAALLGPRLLIPRFPDYELALLPEGEATERSLAAPSSDAPSETPALFHPGTAFQVAVRPLDPIEDLHGTLEVRCLLQAGERLRPWPSCAARAEVASTQAVRIAGTVGETLTLEPGTWTLWLVLGRQGEIADLEHNPTLLQGAVVAKRNWIALQVPRPLRMEPLP